MTELTNIKCRLSRYEAFLRAERDTAAHISRLPWHWWKRHQQRYWTALFLKAEEKHSNFMALFGGDIWSQEEGK